MLFASVAFAAPIIRGTSEALYPPGTELIQVFDNQTAIGLGDSVNTKFLPNQGAWEVVPLGNYSTFEVSIDVSIRCVPGSYYPVSTMTEATTVLLKGVDFSAYRCYAPNLRTLTGGGASTAVDVYYIPRGN